jgi:hypothetical protein
VTFAVRSLGFNGTVRKGQSLQMLVELAGSVASQVDFTAQGRLCLALIHGSSCVRAKGRAPGFWTVRVTPKMVVRGRFTVSALLRGKVVGRRSFRVIP